MSYTQTTWTDETTISPELLNNIENGISTCSSDIDDLNDISNRFYMVFEENTENGPTLNKTFNQIQSAILAGKYVYINVATRMNTSQEKGWATKNFPIIGVYNNNYTNKYCIYANIVKISNDKQITENFVTYNKFGMPGIRTYTAASTSSYPIFKVDLYPSQVCTEMSTVASTIF